MIAHKCAESYRAKIFSSRIRVPTNGFPCCSQHLHNATVHVSLVSEDNMPPKITCSSVYSSFIEWTLHVYTQLPRCIRHALPCCSAIACLMGSVATFVAPFGSSAGQQPSSWPFAASASIIACSIMNISSAVNSPPVAPQHCELGHASIDGLLCLLFGTVRPTS